MTTLRPYPAYKPSDIDWLSDIPHHWSVRRLKHSVVLNPSKSETPMVNSTESVPFVPMERLGIDGRIDGLLRRPHEEVRHGLTYFREQDVLLAKITPCFENGKAAVVSGLAGGFGYGSTEYHVLQAQGALTPQHLYRIVSSTWFRNIGQEFMEGSAGQKRVPTDFVANFPVPLPPLDEQRAIAAFLDVMDARITRFVAARKRMIALLEEQKAAIITQAVTRGLDPDVPIKPSGVDWLGDIPAHWEVRRLKLVTSSRCDGPFGSGLKSSNYVDSGVRVIRLQNIGIAEFKDNDAAFIAEEYYASLGDHDVDSGDVLIAGLGDSNNPCGRACVAPNGLGPAMVKADCFRFRLIATRALPQFTSLQLSATAAKVAEVLSTGATRQRINLQSMAGRQIALSDIQEQNAIAEYLEQMMSESYKAFVRVSNEIELIQEYRTRLISDVVTVKLDVRAVEIPPIEEVVEAGVDVESSDNFLDKEGVDAGPAQ